MLARICAPSLILLLALTTPPAFGAPNPEEARFARHIVPVFSKLGCNQGSCHGAVKGQGGFRLSLFGADPAGDHSHLLRDAGARRVALLDPAASLLLKKATGQVPHQGGQRTAVGSSEYNLLLGWLKQGAPLGKSDDARLKSLTVTPASSTLKIGKHLDLSVKATFADGSSEDVTSLCTFEVQDTDTVSVSTSGRVSAQNVGGTAVVVRYAAEPVIAQILVPRDGSEDKVNFTPVNFVDKHVAARWDKLNLRPAAECDDATFLRRASLDIAGELATPDEVRKFLTDKSADKRAKKIEELLKRPGHAALWATKFCDLLKMASFDANFAMSEAAEMRRAHAWLRARIEENTPYDQLAERILTATSREGRSQQLWLDEVMAMSEENARYDTDPKVYANRRTLDLYWQRKEATGVKGALQVAHAFLGLRLECAQCHRHPHDVWQQDDFLSFANFFMRVKGAAYPDSKKLPADAVEKMKKAPAESKALREQAKKITDDIRNKKLTGPDAAKRKGEAETLEAKARTIENGPKRFGTEILHESSRASMASVTSPLGTQQSKSFRLLGAREPVSVPIDKDPRELVVEWMKQPDNPFFARAIANRVWAHYFGRGIVDPPDHLSPLNPASHPELLDELARHLVKHKFDLRELHRVILTSRTYQLSARPHVGGRADRRNYAYFYLRRMPAEVLVDAINHATGGSESFPKRLHVPATAKALEVPGLTRVENESASLAFAFQVFGRPRRDPQVQCDCERDPAPTIVQTLYLANHPSVRKKIDSPDGRVAQVLKQIKDDKGRVEELFLWTLGRLPKDDEMKASLDHVKDSASPEAGLRDLLWGLLNTREFVLNH